MRNRDLVFLLAFAAPSCQTHDVNTKSTETGSSKAQGVVSAMVDAYNRHEADSAAAAYAPDVKFYHFPGQPFLEGRDAVRTRFQKAFSDAPNVQVEVAPRLVHGRFVIDQENISGLSGGKTVVAVWIYEVRNGLIVQAWRLPDEE